MIKTQIHSIYEKQDLLNTTSSFTERYNLVKLGMLILNAERLKIELSKSDTKTKIQNWIEQWGSFTGLNTFEKVQDILLQDNSESKLLCSLFAINPVRQNIGEKMIEIELQYNNIDFLSPSNNGKNAFYLMSNGEIMTSLKSKPSKEIRSIDFIIYNNNKTFYISQKFTSSNGGGQNNQADHLIKHITDGNNNKNESDIFISLADGEYYTDNMIQQISKYCKKDKSYIMSMDKLINFIKNY